MSDEEFWEDYDIIHNNRHKSVCEIDKMLCERKNFAKRVQKPKSVDTLILEAKAQSFMIERFIWMKLILLVFIACVISFIMGAITIYKTNTDNSEKMLIERIENWFVKICLCHIWTITK